MPTEPKIMRWKVEAAFQPLTCHSERSQESVEEFSSGLPWTANSAKISSVEIQYRKGGLTMRHIIFVVVVAYTLSRASGVLAGDTPQSKDELSKLKREYADVVALEGTAKAELLAIARILRANPKIAIDQTSASGEYCFKSGQGTMVHFATQPEQTPEDVVYEFDASGLIAAGLDSSRLQQLPARGKMTPGVWYFLPRGQQDPHHAHALAKPTIAIAVNIK
jgi:hypothetical protein